MSEGPPPYRITPDILTRVAEIAEAVGRAEASGLSRDLRLRRINRIRTIQGSLAIEGNILSEEQVATILDGKPVVAPLRDVQEARNAIQAYDRYEQWDPAKEVDLLGAHEILMTGLLDAPGHYRRGAVAVMGQARLLSVLDGEMSLREILHALGLRDRKSLRQRYLLPALQGGCVEMTRPDAPSARNQKYRLTPLGQRVRSEAR